MQTCPFCGAQNLPGVLFCGRCGVQIAFGTPAVGASPPQQPNAQDTVECLPAYRPFGLVFSCVWTGLHTLVWLLSGATLLYFAVGLAAVPIALERDLQTVRVSAITIFFVAGIGGLVVTAVALLMICATIGLWLRQRWARNLSAYMQIPTGLIYLLGFIVVFTVLLFSLRMLETNAVGSILGAFFGSLSCFAGIVVSYRVASYLMDPNTDVWFR
jgi:hypothetical protein